MTARAIERLPALARDEIAAARENLASSKR